MEPQTLYAAMQDAIVIKDECSWSHKASAEAGRTLPRHRVGFGFSLVILAPGLA